MTALILGATAGWADCLTISGRHRLAELEVRSCRDALPLLAERMASGRCETFNVRDGFPQHRGRPDLLRVLREGDPPGWPLDVGPPFVVEAQVLWRAEVDTIAKTGSWTEPAWTIRGIDALELAESPVGGSLFVVASCEDFEVGGSVYVEFVQDFCDDVGCFLDTRSLLGPEVAPASPELLAILAGRREAGETPPKAGSASLGSESP